MTTTRCRHKGTIMYRLKPTITLPKDNNLTVIAGWSAIAEQLIPRPDNRRSLDRHLIIDCCPGWTAMR